MMVTLRDGSRAICGSGIFSSDTTDSTGRARVAAEFCGPAKLVVSRAGMRTYERSIDSCAASHVDVVLAPASPPPPIANGCADAAYRFMRAWIEYDEEAARPLLAKPETYVPFSDGTEVKPWRIEIQSANVAQSSCSARTIHRFADGCDFVWELELEQRDGHWLVRSYDQLPPS
jgi:hypothetical protein